LDAPEKKPFTLPEPSPATVLVVDDSSLNRKKMRLAVKKLGHRVDVAEDGETALTALHDKPYDAVLLDIVMPGIDGFDVLRTMKADDHLRDVPVIVISSLDDDSESVVKAIELGAEDFLPKAFDPVLLKARLGASLNKKRFRDQEREYFRRVDRLTQAAEVVESGQFNPEDLALDDLVDRDDALGRLAAVFHGMAEEILERERRLRRSIQLLQGSLLVIAAGVIWGLMPSLARMASNLGSNPLGMALWVNVVAAAFCLSIAAYRGKLPRLGWSEFFFFLLWALLAGIVLRLIMFWVTQHIEASILSLLATLQGFIVFVFAAVMKLEKTSPRRLLGLLVGLGGVVLVLSTRFGGGGLTGNFWLVFALLLPLFYAVEWILLAKRPEEIDIFASVGMMMLLSGIMLLPIVIYSGNMIVPGAETAALSALILLMGIAGASSLLLCFQLIIQAGAVFASQSAYAMTIAGIVWGMLLLNEELSAVAWGAVLMILVGLYLVEPDTNDEKIVLKRSFIRTRKDRAASSDSEPLTQPTET
jgi:CheY-like chemotaxis protein/drug/metabolite transporter (DMT)-like permease